MWLISPTSTALFCELSVVTALAVSLCPSLSVPLPLSLPHSSFLSVILSIFDAFILSPL
eukprot:m.74850 g.74850  ORF g.74850 m.74850 type:complete len:59 (-) comp24703_c0_seq1:158-334(-)